MLWSVVFFFFQDENDDNYEEEPEVADVFDSDFDEDVSAFAILSCFPF